MKRIALVLALLCGWASAQSSPYAAWSNFPQSNTFFPIAVWSQTPNRVQGGSALYSSIPLAMVGTKMNIMMTIDNGSGANYPGSCNTDTSNLFADLTAHGIYSILDVFPLSFVSTSGAVATNAGGQPFNSTVNGTYTIANTNYTILSATSSTLTMTSSIGTNTLVWGYEPVNGCTNGFFATVSSVQNMASGLSQSQFLIGYNMGDEPQGANGCTGLVNNIPSIMTTFDAFDTTRPFFWNHTNWVFNHGSCSGVLNQNALKAIGVGSADTYPMISPFNGLSGTVTDANGVGDYNWIQGWTVATFVADGNAGQPMWTFPDTGTNSLGFSAQNSSSCSAVTNVCTTTGQDPHYYRAPSEVVNAEVWNSLINGVLGIQWFCDDVGNTTNFDFCLGDGGGGTEQSVATAIANNLTYIDTTILNYAKQLQSPINGICTMNTGTSYSSHTTSCTNGILTMSTGTSTVPGSAVVKTFSGTPYLFADSDRNGSATMTFTLTGFAGYTATVVYDSNAQYDPTHSSVGSTFTLNGSGQFSDTFGANGHNYQPKIYTITSSQSLPSTCSPGSGSYTSTQHPACTNPNSGTTVQCYSITTTPVTNGLGTACTIGTLLASGGTITVPVTVTINIVAGTSTLADSTVNSYTYTIVTQATAATCTPTSGVVPQTVTCTNPNSGTTVACYSLTTTPVTNILGTGCTTGTQYTVPIVVSSAGTLKIIAGTSTQTDSNVNSYTYTASGSIVSAPSVGMFAELR